MKKDKFYDAVNAQLQENNDKAQQPEQSHTPQEQEENKNFPNIGYYINDDDTLDPPLRERGDDWRKDLKYGDLLPKPAVQGQPDEEIDWRLREVRSQEYDYLIETYRLDPEKALPVCSIFASNINEDAEKNARLILSLPSLLRENEKLKYKLAGTEAMNKEAHVKLERSEKQNQQQAKDMFSLQDKFSELSMKAMADALKLGQYEKDIADLKNMLRMTADRLQSFSETELFNGIDGTVIKKATELLNRLK